MSKTAQTTLEIVRENDETTVIESDGEKKPCLRDWCSKRIHPNRWPAHVNDCTPPAGWNGGEE